MRLNINILSIKDNNFAIKINDFDKPNNLLPIDICLILNFEYTNNKLIENFNNQKYIELKNIFENILKIKSKINFGKELLFGNNDKIIFNEN